MMYPSTRFLGKLYGLDIHEMNWLLKKQGFLEGIPGEYRVTEKGSKFTDEKTMNDIIGWWDNKILEHLDTSPEKLQEVKAEISVIKECSWEQLDVDQKKKNESIRKLCDEKLSGKKTLTSDADGETTSDNSELIKREWFNHINKEIKAAEVRIDKSIREVEIARKYEEKLLSIRQGILRHKFGFKN